MSNNCTHITCQGETCRRPTEKRPRKPIKRYSAKPKKISEDKDFDSDISLTLWFAEKMSKSKPYCENCGQWLGNLSKIDWKGSQHHVLEKSLFPSVKSHPLNHLVLGRWCCHPQWHTSMLNASKMKIFPKAKFIVEALFELLTQQEKRKVSDYYEIKY